MRKNLSLLMTAVRLNTTVGGHSPVHSTPQEPGSPRETAVEVHAWESEVEEL